MLNKEVRRRLNDICDKHGGKVLFDHLLCGHSTIAIGGNAAAWYVPSSVDELKTVKYFLDGSGVKTFILGAGSNVLIPDEGVDGVVISLSGKAFSRMNIEGTTVTVGAGMFLGRLVSVCCRGGLSGLEGLVGIPATVGGALKMNASFRVAISEYLTKVLIIDGAGRESWLEKKDIRFGYRFSSFDENMLIIRAVFDLKKTEQTDLERKLKKYFSDKKAKQPFESKTLGCVFKNPEGDITSGELIENAGMKGAGYGAAQVSEKHANFILNTGTAACTDVKELMKEVQRTVRDKFSIELDPEIEMW